MAYQTTCPLCGAAKLKVRRGVFAGKIPLLKDGFIFDENEGDLMAWDVEVRCDECNSGFSIEELQED